MTLVNKVSRSQGVSFAWIKFLPLIGRLIFNFINRNHARECDEREAFWDETKEQMKAQFKAHDFDKKSIFTTALTKMQGEDSAYRKHRKIYSKGRGRNRRRVDSFVGVQSIFQAAIDGNEIPYQSLVTNQA